MFSCSPTSLMFENKVSNNANRNNPDSKLSAGLNATVDTLYMSTANDWKATHIGNFLKEITYRMISKQLFDTYSQLFLGDLVKEKCASATFVDVSTQTRSLSVSDVRTVVQPLSHQTLNPNIFASSRSALLGYVQKILIMVAKKNEKNKKIHLYFSFL